MVKIKLILSVYLLIFTCNLTAKDFRLNPNFKIKNSSPQSKYILKDYEKFMNTIKSKSKNEQIKLINSHLNSMRARFDGKKNVDDYWSTRGEFLSRGGGDCEDYAIAKYYTLKDLGLKDKDMCLLVVREKYSNSYHMVLGVWTNSSVPIILDNLSFKILPFTKRVDLVPKYCINEDGYYSVNKKGEKKKLNIIFRAYENMLKLNKYERLWNWLSKNCIDKLHIKKYICFKYSKNVYFCYKMLYYM